MAKTPTGTQTEIIRAAIALISKPNVDHLLYPSIQQALKKILGRCLRKADC